MNWTNKQTHFEKEFEFANQTELGEFVLKLAKLSDKMDHHADMEIYACSKLRVRIGSHDAGSITDRDHEWIKAIDELN